MAVTYWATPAATAGYADPVYKVDSALGESAPAGAYSITLAQYNAALAAANTAFSDQEQSDKQYLVAANAQAPAIHAKLVALGFTSFEATVILNRAYDPDDDGDGPGDGDLDGNA